MLFDLRGSGRRRVVKVVYVTLALLMGGGLVLFGIGGDVSGGLVDAITERGGGSDDTTERLERRERAASQAARAGGDEDPALWAAAARARFNLANAGDNVDQETGAYTAEGRRMLQSATDGWERHIELADRPDARVASLMVQAYTLLGQGVEAVRAQEVLAEERNTAGPYATLAIMAYQEGQTRTGDLAKRKALELTEPDMREALRGQLEAAKTQAAGAG